VVSFPCWEAFEAQSQEYKDKVLPPAVKNRVAVEAAITMGWERYTGTEGKIIGMNGFGASAPFKTLYKEFGITVENILARAKEKARPRNRGNIPAKAKERARSQCCSEKPL